MENLDEISIRQQWRNASDCWLSPSGEIYKCGKLGHSAKATELLKEIYRETDVDLQHVRERLHQHGWARYSTFGTVGWVYTQYPTHSQITQMYFYSGYLPPE